MELWNDFEGKTVADKYRLDHLIGPKGRSAFFTTTNGTGTPSIVRLIESHYDEEEILARWNIVTTLQDDSLVKMRACGQTVLDGTKLVYAVMEQSDAELADILRERALTAEETRQIAISVTEALQTLHDKGLVHEHVKASNIFAIGETVKLRSDCIRESPEGAEGEAVRRHDIHDLCVVLLECLTQQSQLPPVGSMRLSAPFEEVVRNGMSGAWGLQQIANALKPPTFAKAKAASAPAKAAAADAPAAVKAAPVAVPDVKAPAGPPPVRSISDRLADPSNTPGGVASEPRLSHRLPGRIAAGNREIESRHIGLLAAIVAGLIFFGWLGLHLMHRSRAAESSSAIEHAEPTPAPVTVPQRAAPPAPVPAPAPARPSAAVPLQPAAAPAGAHWRVIAYTYNKRDQAQHKADDLAQQHPDLAPEVFTPNGRAPFLVALGSWMSVQDANAFKTKARGKGLPHDIYAQNYGGR